MWPRVHALGDRVRRGLMWMTCAPCDVSKRPPPCSSCSGPGSHTLARGPAPQACSRTAAPSPLASPARSGPLPIARSLSHALEALPGQLRTPQGVSPVPVWQPGPDVLHRGAPLPFAALTARGNRVVRGVAGNAHREPGTGGRAVSWSELLERRHRAAPSGRMSPCDGGDRGRGLGSVRLQEQPSLWGRTAPRTGATPGLPGGYPGIGLGSPAVQPVPLPAALCPQGQSPGCPWLCSSRRWCWRY